MLNWCSGRNFIPLICSLLFSLMLLPDGGALHAQSVDQEEKAAVPEISELIELIGEEGFFDTLTDAYRSIEDPRRSLEYMRHFLPLVDGDSHRYQLLWDMANLEEQLGKFERAQLHYQAAAFAVDDRIGQKALYSSLLLLVEMGRYDQALRQAEQLIGSGRDGDLAAKAAYQKARIQLLRGRFDEALESARELAEEDRELEADLLYGLWTIFKYAGEQNLAEQVGSELKKRFPESPEYRLRVERYHAIPTADIAFGLWEVGQEGAPASEGTEQEPDGGNEDNGDKKSEQGRAIQTGSFQDPENAAFMQQELERRGFTAMLVQVEVGEKKYYRVLVPIPFGEREQHLSLIHISEPTRPY